jgi:hypothetical protein
MAHDPGWAGDRDAGGRNVANDLGPAGGFGLADDPGPAGGIGLANDLGPAGGIGLADDPEPALDPARAAQRPEGREVLKAGLWDRTRGDGGGFAAGGVADDLPPGQVLAGLAGDLWEAGLDRLSDDELIGVLRAARRLASWAAAMELAAVGDLWRRRVAEEDAGDTGAASHADAEIAAALTLTGWGANRVLDLAVAMRRLPATSALLAAGDIDLRRAMVIADELTGLTDDHAAAVDRVIAVAAPGQTTGELRPAARRAVLAADPGAARKRKEQAQRSARVERWDEHAGTAALAGRDLPPVPVLAADQRLTALAGQLKAAGAHGSLDNLRAMVYLALLTGAPVTSLLPADPGCQGHPSSAPGGSGNRGGPGCDNATAPADGGDRAAPADGGSQTGSRAGYTQPGPEDIESRTAADADTARTMTGNGADVAAAAATSADATPADDARAAPPATHPGDAPAPGGALDPAAASFHDAVSARGSVNLILPLDTWLGLSDAPGYASGHGPLDAADSRSLARALAARADTKWCITFTSSDGQPVAHGCARGGASAKPLGARRAARARGGPEEMRRPGLDGGPTPGGLTGRLQDPVRYDRPVRMPGRGPDLGRHRVVHPKTARPVPPWPTPPSAAPTRRGPLPSGS